MSWRTSTRQIWLAMDSYTPLLERTRVPQPSLQKFAVTSIFSKLRSAPTHLGPDSGPGRDAILQCLHSSSPAVVDQSVREFCRLVADSIIDLSFGLVELQSALEGSDPKFVPLFVKGLGFVVRVGFVRCNGSWKFGSIENHPFVKVREFLRWTLDYDHGFRKLGDVGAYSLIINWHCFSF